MDYVFKPGPLVVDPRASPPISTGPVPGPRTPVEPSEEMIANVAHLLSDCRVLLRYLVLRKPEAMQEFTLVQGTQPPQPADAGPLQAKPVVYISLLDETPAKIASTPLLLGQLYTSITTLSHLAQPANVASIHLTSAFLDLGITNQDRPNIVRQKRSLVRWTLATGLFGLLMFIATIALLAHVAQGRKSLQQLHAVQSEYEKTLAAIEQTNLRRPREPGTLTDCQLTPVEPFNAIVAGQEPLCTIKIIERRMQIVRGELYDWNRLSDLVTGAQWRDWRSTQTAEAGGISQQQWQSSELRTAIRLAVFSGLILPVLLGLVGACTHVYRDFSRRLYAWTLYPADGLRVTLRILLGGILGGLVSVIWVRDQPIELEGLTFSLATLAFFVGYGVEIVFRTLDVFIAGVLKKIEN